ncbi:MAG: hypothetical protein MJZ28_07805 [Paludibacteraceae bacterium]|nr:hypothetical protein [Paludibacteraceae bacterium]
MKQIVRILVLLGAMLISSTIVEAQVVRFKSYRSAEGTSGVDKNGLFSWGSWGANKSEITLDLGNESIYVENLETRESQDYKIFGRPKKWIIKRDHKYVSFECADQNYDKVNVKLYQYDNGEFRLSVLSMNRAVRYSVVYEDPTMKSKRIFD